MISYLPATESGALKGQSVQISIVRLKSDSGAPSYIRVEEWPVVPTSSAPGHVRIAQEDFEKILQMLKDNALLVQGA